MIGRKSIVGLSLLSALVFCGLVAQSAMAEFGPSTKLTAVTCAPSPETHEFTDEHCDTPSAGAGAGWKHTTIEKNVATEITATNEKTKNGTTESTPAVLKSTIGGVATTLTATTVHSDPVSFIENTEPSAGVHKVSGTIRTTYTNVTVTGPANCGVVEPIEVHALFEGVDDPVTGKMGLKFSPATGENFAEITLIGASCALNGTTIIVKGSARGTGLGAEGKQGSGTTTIFKPEDESLKIGTKAATFESTVTTKMVEGNGIALTTVT